MHNSVVRGGLQEKGRNEMDSFIFNQTIDTTHRPQPNTTWTQILVDSCKLCFAYHHAHLLFHL